MQPFVIIKKTSSSMSIEKSMDEIKQGKECVDVLSCTRKKEITMDLSIQSFCSNCS